MNHGKPDQNNSFHIMITIYRKTYKYYFHIILVLSVVESIMELLDIILLTS
jgi:hypothetical protein